MFSHRHFASIRQIRVSIVLAAATLAALLASCAGTSLLDQDELVRKARQDPNSLLIVDCVLPPRVVNMGLAMTYMAAGEPVRTTAIDCGIRGGKYVAYDRANYATALEVWLAKAKTGDAEAETNVGEIYEKGVGGTPDYENAALWYRKAADRGYARAQVSLGYLYEMGLGVSKDMATSINWYRKASGLTENDLAFASSMEFESESGAGSGQIAKARSEIQSLRGELSQSRKEIESLSQRLSSSQTQLEANREKLRQTLEALEKARSNLEREKSAPPRQQPQNLERLEQDIKDKEAKAQRENETVKQMEAQFQRKNAELLEKLEKAERRAASLNLDLDKNRFETQRLQSRLAQTEGNLDQAKLDYQARLQKLGEPAAPTAALPDPKSKKLEEKLKRLESSRAQQDEQLQSMSQKIATFEQERARLQAELKKAQSAQPSAQIAAAAPAAGAGPKIEIIDPPLTLTRGMPSVTLRSILPSRPVTGAVRAPAGVMSLIVNDRSQTVNDAGLFKADVSLGKKETPVNITLVDKKGGRVSVDFIFISPESGVTQIAASAAAASTKPADDIALSFGNYYALVIGNDNYRYGPNLNSPVNDANGIGKVLKEKYGFETRILIDATRYDILSALNQMRGKLTEKDNLLIYYAGHGEYDKINQRGQWLPVDAEPDNTANWISTDAITDILNTISAKHILVVADSCYSGAMTRTALAKLETGASEELKRKWMKVMLEKKSRTVLTSGGLEPVLDTGAEGHSIFAKAFIDALSQNDEILPGELLFRKIDGGVRQAAERYGFQQSPQYAPLRHTEHEASDFFFVPKV
jgi:hypothetical protein